MFEKLFLLVKKHAGKAVNENPVIPARYHESVINEASSSIIEVLKTQMESGKFRELIRFFQFSGLYNHYVVTSIVNKFANRLNKFYNIEPKAALETANMLIPAVMDDLIKETKSGNKDFALSNMLSVINGNRADLSNLVDHMMLVA